MTVPADLREQVSAWIDDDPDERTRAELTELLAADDEAALGELADRFAGRLEFGTAGLRGQIAAGPNRMNRAVVIRAAAGLAAYLSDPGAGRHGGDRVRRPAPVPGLRRGHRRGGDGSWAATRFCCRVRCRHRCSPSRSGDWAARPA